MYLAAPPSSYAGLHVLTDTTVCFSHLQLAALALEGGCRVIQYRRKDGSTRELVEEARAMVELCNRYRAMLIVNDRLDVALAAAAHGLHVGQDDLPFDIARKYLGAAKILGCSASSLEQARQAVEQGADYIGYGPVFPTTSKDDASPVKGVEQLRKLRQEFHGPIIAIGGITIDNVHQIVKSGVHGFAVIGAVCHQPDPELATRSLLQATIKR